MDNVCQYCKERRGLSVKRGDSVPKIICLLCLQLDVFGTEHQSEVQIKEEEIIIEDNVLQEESADRENVINQDSIVKEETLEEEPAVNVTIAEEDLIIKEEVLEEEEYYVITEGLEESAMETCLVCQEKHEHMVNIFDDTQESGITIATMISQSIELRIEKGNSSPETICPTCLEFVQNAYESMQANDRDQQLFGQPKNEMVEEDLIQVKNEPVEEDHFEEVQSRESKQKQKATPSAVSPTFHCYHCTLVLSDHISLAIHLRNHEENGDLDRTKEPPHRCPHCDKMFLYASKYKNHIRSHGKPIIAPAPPLKCPQCPKIYFKAGNLEAHKLMHTKDNTKNTKTPPFRCPYCPKIFLYDSFFQDHMQTHKDKEKEKLSHYKCPYCPQNFLHHDLLEIHIRTHDSPKKEPAVVSYKCPDCPEVFSNNLLLNDHMEIHGECSLCHKHKKKSPHRCDHCPLSFITKQHLQKHKLTHKIRADGKRKCSIRKVDYNESKKFVDEDE
nr:zinc finger protein 398 [Drosophila takahashii]